MFGIGQNYRQNALKRENKFSLSRNLPHEWKIEQFHSEYLNSTHNIERVEPKLSDGIRAHVDG